MESTSNSEKKYVALKSGQIYVTCNNLPLYSQSSKNRIKYLVLIKTGIRFLVLSFIQNRFLLAGEPKFRIMAGEPLYHRTVKILLGNKIYFISSNISKIEFEEDLVEMKQFKLFSEFSAP